MITRMKTALCVSLLLVSGLSAEEVTDRPMIESTIARLGDNQPALFTADFSDAPEFARVSSTGTVVISKEPFGEAIISLAPARRFAVVSVRFVTGEVALVDALDRYNDLGTVLLVMKKEGTEWKVASFKRIAENKKTAP
jgi:hypothetical protein